MSSFGRLLLFTLDSCRYAIATESVSGLAECRTVRKVPGAPEAVLGLAEWRGQLLTILDLPRLLNRTGVPGRACLVRLAPPLQHTALFLPAAVRIASVPARGSLAAQDKHGGDGVPRSIRHDGRTLHLIEPLDLLATLEKEMRERC